MRIDVQVDSAQLLLRLRNGEKRLSFAVVNALNNTAKRIQASVREHVFHEFTVRKVEFIRREAAKITFANVRQGKAFAEVAVGQKARFFLSGFEQGGPRPRAKGKTAAAPFVGGPARPAFPSPVPQPFRFSALRLHKTRPNPSAGLTKKGKPKRTKAAKDGVRYGLEDTYQVPDVGVFQHVPGQERGRPVYFFLEDEQLQGDRLDFISTATSVANTWFKEEMERETAAALAHDAGRSF